MVREEQAQEWSDLNSAYSDETYDNRNLSRDSKEIESVDLEDEHNGCEDVEGSGDGELATTSSLLEVPEEILKADPSSYSNDLPVILQPQAPKLHKFSSVPHEGELITPVKVPNFLG
ncbi:unnamed protein product [Sphagnum jensenii]|uniref:Uncharacterized protein n=1 Tax=Sphagnum jensenii TaxID=128206 RepID=A0ABP0WTF3_9BRYO